MNPSINTAPAASVTEDRKFRMHPDLLFSVIKSQAGTLNKALLELVMNSVDAGASRVDIKLDRKTFTVSDDGKGFTEREQIAKFFETFGQPHQDGDAIFGKFRMGRGQAMSFAKNEWRSGPFRMLVDIKGKGLDYSLETGLETVKGCHITGELYDTVDPSEKRRIEMDLAEQCTYTPAPVFLNGRQISKNAADDKWTVETDDAFILVNTSRSMAVYNLGVLVSNFSAHEFGVGGVVVSKKQLTLNFARNDVLRNQCEVWKAIRSELKKHVPKHDAEKPVKRDENWRKYQAELMMCLDGKSASECNDFAYMPIFTDIKGKHWSIGQLAGLDDQMPIVVAPGKSLLADRLQDSKIACVLTPETFDERFGCDITETFTYIASFWPQTAGFLRLAHCANRVLKKIRPFEEVSSTIDSEHQILTPNEVPADAHCALEALEVIEPYIRTAISQVQNGCDIFQARKLRAMKSDSAEAFTDGVSNIFINLDLLRGVDGPNRGIEWAHQMCSLLLHEYLHDFNSGTGHTHDAEFYHLFHESVFSVYMGRAVAALFREWVKQSEKKKKKFGAMLSSQIDLDAKLQDRTATSPDVKPQFVLEMEPA